MATKAELEAELAALKHQMDEQTASTSQTAPPDGAPPEDAPAPMAEGDQDLSATLDALKAGDVAGLAGQIEHELKDLSLNKPVMTALGAFALGFVVGRASK